MPFRFFRYFYHNCSDMRSLDSWLTEYGESHQNSLNKKIHWICVPSILWSILTLLSELRFGALHGGWIAVMLAVLYYWRLNKTLAIFFLLTCSLLLFMNGWLFGFLKISAWIPALVVFALAWLGQFYGHSVEGKKPSFLKDVQFLLIGPLWLMYPIIRPSTH